MQDNISSKQKHTLFLENRETLELSGIKKVGAFNEEEINASCDWGEISIKGSSLHIEVLDLETGALKIRGRITAFIYNDTARVKGLFGRLFS